MLCLVAAKCTGITRYARVWCREFVILRDEASWSKLECGPLMSWAISQTFTSDFQSVTGNNHNYY